jgi:IclR helix-turn-helix domain
VPPIAHIGGIPVEEWLPFVVPVLAIYVYIRRRERKRRAEVQRVVQAGREIDEPLVGEILAEWSAANHGELTAEHVRMLAPPGLNGASAPELAARAGCAEETTRGLVADLEELGYVERDGAGADDERVWLTAEGYELANIAERAVLSAFAHERDARAATAGE